MAFCINWPRSTSLSFPCTGLWPFFLVGSLIVDDARLFTSSASALRSSSDSVSPSDDPFSHMYFPNLPWHQPFSTALHTQLTALLTHYLHRYDNASSNYHYRVDVAERFLIHNLDLPLWLKHMFMETKQQNETEDEQQDSAQMSLEDHMIGLSTKSPLCHFTALLRLYLTHNRIKEAVELTIEYVTSPLCLNGTIEYNAIQDLHDRLLALMEILKLQINTSTSQQTLSEADKLQKQQSSISISPNLCSLFLLFCLCVFRC